MGLGLMKYNLYVSTDEGKVRETNEDNFLVNKAVREIEQNKVNIRGLAKDEPIVCAVFDGMGGEALGEVASKICADEAVGLYKLAKDTRQLQDADIDAYVQRANDKIVEEIRSNRARRGGSTLAMVYINNGTVYAYSSGDSRIYLYRDSELIRISEDHTLAMKKYKANIYTKEEAENSADSHKLTSFVGVDVDNRGLKVEKYDSFNFEENDKILICSDGLYDMCSEEEIAELLSKESKIISYDLVREALKNGGIDNVTCLVIELSKE